MLKLSRCSVFLILAAFLVAGCSVVQKTTNQDKTPLEQLISTSGKNVDLDSNDSLDVAFGGHNSNSASGARTSLGLAIGTDVLAPTGDGSALTGITASQVGAQATTSNLDTLSVPTAWRLFYSDGSGVQTELALGTAGAALISQGAAVAPIWDVVAGSGGGTIGGSLGGVDNIIVRSDGTGGVTAQGSSVTISDAGTVNIPTGQTYNINGVAHAHNYQPLNTNLTSYGTVAPGANVLSLLGAVDYSAMRTQLSLVPGTNVQAYDADLLALAAISGVRGDIIYYGAGGWTRLPKGTLAQVLKQGADDPLWGDASTGSGISRWDQLGAPTADLSLAQGAYKSSFSSTDNTLGSTWTFTNSTAAFTYATSFVDYKLTANGDANGYYLRGFDNSGADEKWSIGPEGAFTGYSFSTRQAATGGVLDLLEGSATGTNYVRFKVADALAANYQIDVPSASGAMLIEGTATGGVILGDASPDAAGEIGYASTQLIFHDGTAARNVAKAGTLTDTKWCTSDGVVINCATNAPAGSGDFLADGSVPLTGALTSTGNQNIGSTSAEAGNIYIADSKVIYGQNDQSATLTSGAGKFTANAFAVTNALTAGTINGHTFTSGSSTFTGSAGQTYTLPTTTATLARTDAANTFTGHQTIEGVTSTGATGTGRLVFDGTPTLVTPVIGAATGTSLLVTGIVDGTSPVTITTGDTATIGNVYKSGYIINANSTATNPTTYTLPTAELGRQYCTRNYLGETGALRINTSAAGQYIDMDGTALTASGGYVISGGASGDAACFVGISATVWIGYRQKGTWTAN